jgi:hypothetical protein
MLCTQFLASCLRPSHPSNATVKLPPGPRKIQHGRPLKETLSSRFHDAVSPYLWGDLNPSGLYNKIKNDIQLLLCIPTSPLLVLTKFLVLGHLPLTNQRKPYLEPTLQPFTNSVHQSALPLGLTNTLLRRQMTTYANLANLHLNQPFIFSTVPQTRRH